MIDIGILFYKIIFIFYDNTIYKKFIEKYETQKDELQSKIENPSLSSSNLELAIDKALTLSESLEKIWVDGDLKQRQKLQNLVFPSGLGYDKSNDRVRTPKVNAIFGSIPILSKEISNIKKGEPIPVNQFSDCVTQTYGSSNFLSCLYSIIQYTSLI